MVVKDQMTGDLSTWSESSHWWIDGSVHSDLPIPALAEMFNATHFIVSQVNPHVIPFIPQGDIFPGKDVPQIMHLETRHGCSLFRAAKLEVLRRMEFLSSFKPLDPAMKRLAFVMNQHYYGDINILPEIKQETFRCVLNNPTPDFMIQACLAGERATWPRLGRIRNHCAVEYALETAMRIMRAKITIAASYSGPTLSHIRLNTNEASRLRKIIATLRIRSQEYDFARPVIERRKTGHPPAYPDKSRPAEKHDVHVPVHHVYHSSEHVRFRPSLKHHLTSSVISHQSHPPQDKAHPDDSEHHESIDLFSPLSSNIPSTRDSSAAVFPPPEAEKPHSFSSQRPSIEEAKEPSWICDESEWPLPPLDADPAAPALTLQALIMAAKSGHPSPEQEYHRLSRKTSDWGHCGA